MTPDPQGCEVQDLRVTRGGRVVLDGITLSLTQRRIGIIGRNGSGKSTLARTLAGLQRPDTGQVRIAGIDPVRDRRGMLDRLGILFQNPDHQIFMPSVAEELAFGLIQQGHGRAAARDRVHTLLAEHHRADWADRPVTALSEGQRRYLCLMSVLAMEPRTILLDEPFAGLDLPTSWHLDRVLAGLAQQLVLITHDPRNLEGWDRVIWLDGGRIAGDGPASEITAQYLDAMRREADARC
ncbi:energy-coupling factor ABC transporter ATP-binding protein [Pseudooceanicola aestuarii]|uniref:energy-coupling factor ABC transporter ATP-binding protein n=1 Tax=Pseudooceanicola aestuarii TaxID=2697319 RepID=UPI0013D8E0BB|nr:ABC transporter ATP-binding protein [Pseudooceanicola aestuarii]